MHFGSRLAEAAVLTALAAAVVAVGAAGTSVLAFQEETTTTPPQPALLVSQRLHDNPVNPAVLRKDDQLTIAIEFADFAGDGTETIEARFDKNFFTLADPEAPTLWEEIEEPAGTRSLQLIALEPPRDRSAAELRTEVRVLALVDDVEIDAATVTQTFTAVVAGAANRVDRGRIESDGALGLNMAPGDCIDFSVNVLSGGLGDGARLVIEFSDDVYQATAPVSETEATEGETAPEATCVVPPRMEIVGNTLSTPIVSNTATEVFALRVRDSARVADELAVTAAVVVSTGEVADDRDVAAARVTPVLWRVDVSQQRVADGVADGATGAMVRLFPEDQLEVIATISTSAEAIPSDVRLHFEFGPPLVAGENPQLTVEEGRIEGTSASAAQVNEAGKPTVTHKAILQVPASLPEAERGKVLEIVVRGVLIDQELAKGTVQQRVPASISVAKAFADESGAPITEFRAGQTVRVTLIVTNNSGTEHRSVKVVDVFDGSLFQPEGAEAASDEGTTGQGEATTTTGEPASPADVAACTTDNGNVECVVEIAQLAVGTSEPRFYVVQVRSTLNVGTVETVLETSVESEHGGRRVLPPAPLQLLSPLVSLELTGPTTLVAGSQAQVVATLTNSGDVPARGLLLEMGVKDGVEHVVALSSTSPGESSEPEAGTAPFADGAVLTWVVNDLPAGETTTRQFTAQIAEPIGNDSVSWSAQVMEPISLAASQTTAAQTAPAGTGSQDRLEDDKTFLIAFVVVAPLIALIALLVLRTVATIPAEQFEKALEVLVVIFLISVVLVMTLAGGLEPESAAALVGGVSGYVLGRTVSGLRGRSDGEPGAGPPEEPVKAESEITE